MSRKKSVCPHLLANYNSLNLAGSGDDYLPLAGAGGGNWKANTMDNYSEKLPNVRVISLRWKLEGQHDGQLLSGHWTKEKVLQS